MFKLEQNQIYYFDFNDELEKKTKRDKILQTIDKKLSYCFSYTDFYGLFIYSKNNIGIDITKVKNDCNLSRYIKNINHKFGLDLDQKKTFVFWTRYESLYKVSKIILNNKNDYFNNSVFIKNKKYLFQNFNWKKDYLVCLCYPEKLKINNTIKKITF